jgi:hypothetical protein
MCVADEILPYFTACVWLQEDPCLKKDLSCLFACLPVVVTLDDCLRPSQLLPALPAGAGRDAGRLVGACAHDAVHARCSAAAIRPGGLCKARPGRAGRRSCRQCRVHQSGAADKGCLRWRLCNAADCAFAGMSSGNRGLRWPLRRPALPG